MKVYITRPILPVCKEILESKGIKVVTGPNEGTPSLELKKIVSEYDGLVSMLSDNLSLDIFDNSNRLKVIANYAVGFDNINLELCKKYNVKVGNTPGVLTEATAELALTLMLAIQRQVKAAERYIQAGKWQTWHPTDLMGHNLADRKIGVIGMGRIGLQFSKMCHHAFGSKIFYTHTREHKIANETFNATRLSVQELFKTCDIISIHCPLNASTEQLIDKKLLELTNDDFILINTARGKVVNTEDLYNALESKQIWGVGLDVTEPEPLNASHPLYSHDRCIILPHLGSATIEARSKMAQMAAHNILAGLKGEQLPHQVS